MNLKQIEEEFDKKYSSEWWNGFGTTDDINKQGINSIKQFYRQKIEEMLDEINPYNRKYNNGCKCDQCNMISKIEELRI